ncbi:hypothetical protein GE21DRAFT_58 [Neurospora crassa]|uniref:Secreted protein n=1 Tax=Neurospora crassa (strain ATCC 24698 / 74-OR23-1A / CBS 708.71 / DSM 1257 / FGSC 987) TaxID=367110 RepID=V5IR95_NEUCR|nr:hypothetical protein NCU16306 [Neurospora crassa OR74A]ESA43751.1 hypothetical protein NCU16306 [Neurospora crassa OR74A]KHE84538.1 hypothetical protein GE21DRAFT_58 [Neurospora crassa]|eukprot:XP_011393326.1 hypothetical protein NCU16306 [Neurospora crassa OR74A]
MQRPNTTWIPLLVSCILHFSLRRCRCLGPAPPCLLHFTLTGKGDTHTHTWTQTYRQGLARGMVFSSFFFFFFFLAFFFFCWLDFFWALVPINPVHSFDCRSIVAANSGASAVRFDTQRFFFFF